MCQTPMCETENVVVNKMNKWNECEEWTIHSQQNIDHPIKSFATHHEVQQWITHEGKTNHTYLVKHFVDNEVQYTQGCIPFVEQWTAFPDCLCAASNHGPFSPWVQYDFHNKDEFENRGKHPKPKTTDQKFQGSFDQLFQTTQDTKPKIGTRLPPPKTAESWKLFKDINMDMKPIKEFPTFDALDRWIRNNGDEIIIYYSFHIVNNKLNLVEEWQYFNCQHGWFHKIFRNNSNDKQLRALANEINSTLKYGGTQENSEDKDKKTFQQSFEPIDTKQKEENKSVKPVNARPTIMKWKRSKGMSFNVSTVNVDTNTTQWELVNEWNERIFTAQSRDELHKWLSANGNRNKTYYSKHIVNGTNQMYEEGRWRFGDGKTLLGIFSIGEWIHTELCNERKDSHAIEVRQ